MTNIHVLSGSCYTHMSSGLCLWMRAQKARPSLKDVVMLVMDTSRYPSHWTRHHCCRALTADMTDWLPPPLPREAFTELRALLPTSSETFHSRSRKQERVRESTSTTTAATAALSAEHKHLRKVQVTLGDVCGVLLVLAPL